MHTGTTWTWWVHGPNTHKI